MKPKELDRRVLLQAALSGLFPLFVRSADEQPDPAAGEESKDTVPDVTPVIASTAAADRYDDVIDQSGWELGNFKANPVIQPFHDYATQSVGRGEKIRVEEMSAGKLALKMDIRWDMGLALGADLARQYAGGFARGVSVGFRPLSFAPRSQLPADHAAKADAGFYIERAELLELSTAPVPVQQEALAAKAMGSAFKSLGGAESEVNGLTRSDIIDLIVKTFEDDPRVRSVVLRMLIAAELSKPEPGNHSARSLSDLDGSDLIAAFIAG